MVKTVVFELPTMYGDHHVLEVRHLLLEVAGVEEIYASSAFQAVEVHYDETKVIPDEIKSKLNEAGYLDPLPIPVERGAADGRQNDDKPYFRRTTTSTQTRQVVGFAQSVPGTGRPLWPCPGLGTIKQADEEVTHG